MEKKTKCWVIYERYGNKWEKKIPASSNIKGGFKTKKQALKFIGTLNQRYGYDEIKVAKEKC